MTVYDFIEDWDNAELSEYDWQEQMEEAVRDYNYQYNERYDPTSTVRHYVNMNRFRNWYEEN